MDIDLNTPFYQILQMPHHIIPEVFTNLRQERDCTLYQYVYSILLDTDRLTAFRGATMNDLPQFINLVIAHLPANRNTREEIMKGLHGVHYALTHGPDMFYKNYNGCLANDV